MTRGFRWVASSQGITAWKVFEMQVFDNMTRIAAGVGHLWEHLIKV